jgi:hypothetical protein
MTSFAAESFSKPESTTLPDASMINAATVTAEVEVKLLMIN